MLAVAALTAVVVALPLLWSMPSVRRLAHQSFTRLPATYTEMYFSEDPIINLGHVEVPVSVVEHGDRAVPVRLRVWLAAARGRVIAERTVGLTPRLETPAKTVVLIPLRARSLSRRSHMIVWVSLQGGPQTLHYRL